jgi:hypothetical protein
VAGILFAKLANHAADIAALASDSPVLSRTIACGCCAGRGYPGR